MLTYEQENALVAGHAWPISWAFERDNNRLNLFGKSMFIVVSTVGTGFILSAILEHRRDKLDAMCDFYSKTNY